MQTAYAISGLYAITPDTLDTPTLLAQLEAALQGGAQVVQYRNKIAPPALQLAQAQAVLSVCRHHRVPLIVNDDVMLCQAIGADGVHLGAEDGSVLDARAQLGAEKIIGASCYNQFALAQRAQHMGASYVAFGACFSSSTKPLAVKASLDLFGQALHIPKVAIGGITLENAPQVISAGANAIAVIHALFNAPEIIQQARQFSDLF